MTDRDTYFATLAAGARSLCLELDDSQCAAMWAHFQAVLETNRQFNLTRVTDPAEAAAKLYADSLAPAAWIAQSDVAVRSCLDIGTGAGFPAVPLAVLRPAWRVTAIDSTGKKAEFLRQCAASLSLSNLRVEHVRGGEWRPSRKFDLVVFKAVGPLAKCLSTSSGLVSPGGVVIVHKGPSLSRGELDEGQTQAEALGMQTWDTVDYTLPFGEESLEHTLVVYRSVG
jgi:16S rRNA (guanine527-N7)-methyltransferase